MLKRFALPVLILVGFLLLWAAPLTARSFCPSHILPMFLCEDTKTTDWALVFFTYSLAVVGWFTLRSNERTAEAIERAYVFPGHSDLSDENGYIRFTFRMTNVGRMPAGIKEVGYRFLDRDKLPKRLRDRDWEWGEVIPYDWIIPSAIGALSEKDTRKDIKELTSPYAKNHLFVGYIKYQDLFTKRMRTSWMAMHLYPGKPEKERKERAGGDVWNGWD